MSFARSSRPHLSALATAVALTLASSMAAGQQGQASAAQPAAAAEDVLEEVVVFARGEALIGKAAGRQRRRGRRRRPAVRPLLRVAELLEVVPGMIAVQHSGRGKANQYFLRGFNLDHGTDFTTYIDDVPMNLRTHGHGQGYLDVNGLIPEVIDRIDYRKGTVSRRHRRLLHGRRAVHDARSRGSTPFMALEGGNYGWQRAGRRHVDGESARAS